MDLSAFRGGADNAAAYEALVGTTGTIPSPSFLPKVAPLAAPAGALSDPEAVAELRKLVEARLATLDADAQKMVEAHMDEFTLQQDLLHCQSDMIRQHLYLLVNGMSNCLSPH